nr:MAG TPA: hypothetical protein [Caudoviricetes sp.]DAY35111.1 MAG TPA: hypothetical protein [Caudoviricetes sp.]
MDVSRVNEHSLASAGLFIYALRFLRIFLKGVWV